MKTNFTRLLSFALVTIFILLMIVPTVFAEGIQEEFSIGEYLKIEGQGQGYLETAEERGISPVAAFIVDLIDFLAKLIGTVALLIFIAGALLTIVSEGNDDRLQKGKQAMIYSLIGVVIAFSAYMIATFVQSIFY